MVKQLIITSCIGCSFCVHDEIYGDPHICTNLKPSKQIPNPSIIPDFCPLTDAQELRQFRLSWFVEGSERFSILWLPPDTTEDNLKQHIPDLLEDLEHAMDDGYEWSFNTVSSPSTT
jgi:hypothetical protein